MLVSTICYVRSVNRINNLDNGNIQNANMQESVSGFNFTNNKEESPYTKNNIFLKIRNCAKQMFSKNDTSDKINLIG